MEFPQPWRGGDAKSHAFHVVDLVDDGHKDEAAEYLANLLIKQAEVHAEVRRLLSEHYGTSTPEA